MAEQNVQPIMQGGTPLHMGYPMCNSHLKPRKENSYAKANFKFYLDCATAKISNCTLDGGGIVNSLAQISENLQP